MSRQDLINLLTPLARDAFSSSDLILLETMSAATVPSWTSLTFMKFLSNIENSLGFKYKMIEIMHLNTIGDVLDATLKHVENA